MAITSSILTGGSNNHPTTSEEANGVYTDFVSEGIVGSVGNTSGVAPATGGFSVNAQGTPDMTVAVGSGVAYVTGTPSSQNSQTFRIKNTASSNVTISANSSGSTKYDWVYISLSAANLANPNVAGDNAATLVTSRSSSAASDDGTPPTYGYPLAVVTVANGASSITNGNIRDIRTQVALNTGTSGATDGWTALSGTPTVSSGYNKGNKEFDLTFASSMAAILSPGMRLKVTRATTPPTQCTDLEASSSQYASKSSPTGITFTDDFTCEAWIKPESYTSGVIIGRSDATPANGFVLRLDAAGGNISVIGYNAGAGNYRIWSSYQAIPLDKWTHVAATFDMSGFTSSTCKIYINGMEVPGFGTSAGTNPTTLVQSGDLAVGRHGSAALQYFDGKVADVRVWSALRTATQIRDNMNQQLVGNETNLVAYYKLDGNFNDSTSNANNLTAGGSALATNVDNPMKATEYAIVTKVATTTVTVFTGTDYNIPNLTLSTPYYSTQDSPFGFPAKASFKIESFYVSASITNTPADGAWYNPPGRTITSPVNGIWEVGYSAPVRGHFTTGSFATMKTTLSTGATTEVYPELTVPSTWDIVTAGVSTHGVQHVADTTLEFTAAITLYLNHFIDAQGAIGASNGFNTGHKIYFKCAYV